MTSSTFAQSPMLSQGNRGQCATNLACDSSRPSCCRSWPTHACYPRRVLRTFGAIRRLFKFSRAFLSPSVLQRTSLRRCRFVSELERTTHKDEERLTLHYRYYLPPQIVHQWYPWRIRICPPILIALLYSFYPWTLAATLDSVGLQDSRLSL